MKYWLRLATPSLDFKKYLKSLSYMMIKIVNLTIESLGEDKVLRMSVREFLG